MADKTSIDFDNYSLDDLPDLPGFVTFPTGAYKIRLEEGLVRKTVGEHETVECRMTLVEVLEIPNAEEASEVKQNDVCSTLFMLDNEFGLGKLKLFATPIAKHLGVKRLPEILAGSKGLELIVAGKRTTSKKDKDATFFNIVNVDMV